MNREQLVCGQVEKDHFEEIPRSIGPDREDLRRIRLEVEIDDDNGVVDGMQDVGITDPMSSRRAVDLHTEIS